MIKIKYREIFVMIILILFSYLKLFSCGKDNDHLIKFFEGQYDEIGVKSGYINSQGDTVIPLGKYYYCYTDTLKKYAIVLKHDGKCIAIDKAQNELYEIYWFDNGPDYFSDGLFRIVKNRLIGYADENGEIIILPQYECAYPFENGKAQVTYSCDSLKNGEYIEFISDTWFFINKKGNIIHD